eukprot:3069875-Prymnesium_polylepis.1
MSRRPLPVHLLLLADLTRVRWCLSSWVRRWPRCKEQKEKRELQADIKRLKERLHIPTWIREA